MKKYITTVLKNKKTNGHLWFRSLLIFVCCSTFLLSCSDFVEVELPSSQLNADDIFTDISSANAAMASIYAEMRDGSMVSDLSYQMGNYADELDYYGSMASDTEDFNKNTVISSNGTIKSWWNTAYNLIYSANSILERVENSKQLSTSDCNQLKGEALFVRAYLHFYLAQLYGAVPYVTTTNYSENAKVVKIPVDQLYLNVLEDLKVAEGLLGLEYVNPNRTRPNRGVVKALMARIYLYTDQWEAAAQAASYCINNTGTYTWNTNLNTLFLKDNTTTIWQWSPEFEGQNTNEGQAFIFFSVPPGNVALNPELVASFETNDLRLDGWIKGLSDGETTWYYAYKYKEQGGTDVSREYSVIFRLAEQYLIRSEARVQNGDIEGGVSDLNKIRNRAGLSEVGVTDKATLLKLILEERRHEYFTELGHRFFDLKRTEQLDTVLGVKPGWNTTDRILPLPEDELLINPNLEPQNKGY